MDSGRRKFRVHSLGLFHRWSQPTCHQCDCQPIIGAIGITISRRTCSNPFPTNGGQECGGSSVRAVVCNRSCPQQSLSVNQVNFLKTD